MSNASPLPLEAITHRIYVLRGLLIEMIDTILAQQD